MSTTPTLPKRLSMKRLAELTGFSPATVSLVLNGKAESIGIKADTREAIKTAAENHGYRPNHLATALRTGMSNIIAVGGITQTHWRSERTKLITNLLSDAGLRIHRFDFRWDNREARLLDDIADLRPAGLILSEGISPAMEPRLQRLQEAGTVIIGIDILNDLPIDKVMLDRQGIGYAAADHLLSQGHRRLAYFTSEDNGAWMIQERIKGFRQAHRDHGIEVTSDQFVMPAGKGGATEAYDITQCLLRDGCGFTGMLVTDPFAALGIYRACREAGANVPNEISIIADGDFDGAEHLPVPLTVQEYPTEAIATAAVDRLTKRLNGDTSPPTQQLIASQLIVRGSTASP